MKELRFAFAGFRHIASGRGVPFAQVPTARYRQALEHASTFRDAGQFMLKLANGAGVIGDVSYSALETQSYSHPACRRFDFWDTRSMVKFHPDSTVLRNFLAGTAGETRFGVPDHTDEGCPESFRNEIAGRTAVPEAARRSLLTQAVADAEYIVFSGLFSFFTSRSCSGREQKNSRIALQKRSGRSFYFGAVPLTCRKRDRRCPALRGSCACKAPSARYGPGRGTCAGRIPPVSR